jgi:Mg/Co/Ni transporter MgtE
MNGNLNNRVFLARLAGTAVFDPNGDPVGKVRDAVVTLRANNQPPRILGLVVEVPLRRRVFVPITRVTSIESGTVVITGLVNMRRFEPRTGEILVLGDLLDRQVTLIDGNESVVVEDMGMEPTRTGDWLITKIHVMRRARGLRRKGATSTVAWEEVHGFASHEQNQGVANLLSTLSNLRAADLAAVLHDLAPKRRVEVARALDDERLADVLEEMDEVSRVSLLAELEGERAADVLGEMDPDDAADLLREIGQREQLHYLS